MLSWNADGLRRKVQELLDLVVSALFVDIVAVCETKLTPQISLHTPGFSCYRKDKHHTGRGQGVAILVRENVEHSLLTLPKTKHMEAVGVKLLISGTEHIIVSVYQSPNLPLLHSDLSLLLGLGKHVLLMGDFNANHEFWNSPYSNTRGRSLFQHMLHNEYVIHASDTPSQLNYRAGLKYTNPDLVLCQNVSDVGIVRTIPALSSNHLPLYFTVGGALQIKPMKQYFRFRDANWKGYRSQIDEHIHLSSKTLKTKSEIDNAVCHLTNVIIEARNRHVPTSTATRNGPKLPRRIKKLIKLKNRLRRVDQNLTNKEDKRFIRSQIHILQLQVDLGIQRHNDSNWDQKLAKVDNPSNDIWRVIDSIKPKSYTIPPLKLSDGSVTSTTLDQCNALAEAFRSNMCLTVDWISSNLEAVVRESIDKLNNYKNEGDDIKPTYPREVWKSLCNLKARKSPGSDELHNLLLKNLSQKAVVYLTKIFNGCMGLSYFPEAWKHAKIIPLKKPGKDESLPVSYRPISLLPALGKLFEKNIYKRILNCTSHIIKNEQFGFRESHSTVHQLARVAEHITHNLNLKQSTGMFLLDIEKAFDTVWHDGLLHKLGSHLPLSTVKLIQSYLTNRSFQVHVNDHKSLSFFIPAGVPQGSILGPYLFLMYINDLPVQTRTHLACFADDTASYTSADEYDLIVDRLQLSLDSLLHYFTQWKLKLNASKTESIMFTRHRKPPSKTLKINGYNIPWSDGVRYLGVTLDSKMNWSKHVSKTRIRGAQLMGALSPILNRRSNLSPVNKLRIYTTLVRPCITYACPVWSSTCDSNYSLLQVIQNKALKIAYNTPFYTNLTKLHLIIKLPTLKNFIIKQSRKFYSKNKHNINKLIQIIGQTHKGDLSYIDKYGTYRLPHHYCLFANDVTPDDT